MPPEHSAPLIEWRFQILGCRSAPHKSGAWQLWTNTSGYEDLSSVHSCYSQCNLSLSFSLSYSFSLFLSLSISFSQSSPLHWFLLPIRGKYSIYINFKFYNLFFLHFCIFVIKKEWYKFILLTIFCTVSISLSHSLSLFLYLSLTLSLILIDYIISSTFHKKSVTSIFWPNYF